MKNITTNFEEFINEGLFSKIKNKFINSDNKEFSDVRKTVEIIFNDIKNNFKIYNLDVKVYDYGKYTNNLYIYTTFKDDIIEIYGPHLNKIKINNIDITEYLEEEKIEDLYSFITNKLNNKNKIEMKNNTKDKINTIKNLYDKYIDVIK
jgi:hypothetical protein